MARGVYASADASSAAPTGSGRARADLDELRDVVLVPVAARVRDRAEQALRLGELGARSPVLHLARRAGELPRPASEDLVGRRGLPLADRPQEDSHAGGPVLLPRQRLADERDEIVEVGPLDRRRHPIGQGGHPQAAVLVLGRADREERLERTLAGAALGELPRELGALVEPDLPAGDRRPEALLVVVEELRIDPLPLALDHREPPGDVGCDGHEPRDGREQPARSALLASCAARA